MFTGQPRTTNHESLLRRTQRPGRDEIKCNMRPYDQRGFEKQKNKIPSENTQSHMGMLQ